MSFSSTSDTVVALGDFDELDDVALASAAGPLADHARATAVLQARSAAAVARLSDPSLGLSGLARRHGFVNA